MAGLRLGGGEQPLQQHVLWSPSSTASALPPHTYFQYTSLVHFLAAGGYQNPYDDGRGSVSNIDHWGHHHDRMSAGIVRDVATHVKAEG